MTSSNGNIFRVTGPLCREFTGHGEFPSQRPMTGSFDVFVDLRQNKRLSKQSWGWWFLTPSCPLWCQCNGILTLGNDYVIYYQWSFPNDKCLICCRREAILDGWATMPEWLCHIWNDGWDLLDVTWSTRATCKRWASYGLTLSTEGGGKSWHDHALLYSVSLFVVIYCCRVCSLEIDIASALPAINEITIWHARI